jgi:hypothetical protein
MTPEHRSSRVCYAGVTPVLRAKSLMLRVLRRYAALAYACAHVRARPHVLKEQGVTGVTRVTTRLVGVMQA